VLDVLIASLKFLTNYENACKNPLQNSHLRDWAMFSIADLSLMAAGKCARINLSQTASGMILQNDRRLPMIILNVRIRALGSLKRVTGRIFIMSKYRNFTGAS
jgi:hypothetical protein